MAENLTDKTDTRSDVIEAMRGLADRNGTVRDLVELVQTELDLKKQSLLPVLWYFMKAFSLPLDVVLPIREWLYTGDDAEIDAQILPAIRKANAGKWMRLAKPI